MQGLAFICGRLRAQFSSTFFQKVSVKEKSKISGFFLYCIERKLQKYRDVSFTADQKCKLEKQKELVEMQLAADTDSDAYEEDSSVEDSDVEAEL
jgi:hypothetical protein